MGLANSQEKGGTGGKPKGRTKLKSTTENTGENASVIVTEKKTLEARFTVTQLQYLRSRAPDYKAASLKLRSHISREAADFLIKGAEAGGDVLGQKEVKAILANVRLWFSQRCRKRKAIPRWTHHWTGRQVFYKAHASRVGSTQQRLFIEATNATTGDLDGRLKDEGEFDLDMAGEETSPEDEENAVPDDDGETDADAGTGTGTGVGAGTGAGTGAGAGAGTGPSMPKQPQMFDFFQKALSIEYSKLTDEEREGFEKQALEWRKNGPDGDEKKRAAEKYAALWIDQFAQDLFTQFGARVCVLLSYQDSADTHNISIVDRNDRLGAPTTFKLWARSSFERSGLLEKWGQYTTNLLPSIALPEVSLGNLIELPHTGKGERLVPEVSIEAVPDGYPPYIYFAKVTRTIVLHAYAIVRGRPLLGNQTTRRTSPPWSDMAKCMRDYVRSEYITDEMARDWGEPGDMGLANTMTFLEHIRRRQQEGLIGFEFSQWKDGKGRFQPPVEVTPPSTHGTTAVSDPISSPMALLPHNSFFPQHPDPIPRNDIVPQPSISSRRTSKNEGVVVAILESPLPKVVKGEGTPPDEVMETGNDSWVDEEPAEADQQSKPGRSDVRWVHGPRRSTIRHKSAKIPPEKGQLEAERLDKESDELGKVILDRERRENDTLEKEQLERDGLKGQPSTEQGEWFDEVSEPFQPDGIVARLQGIHIASRDTTPGPSQSPAADDTSTDNRAGPARAEPAKGRPKRGSARRGKVNTPTPTRVSGRDGKGQPRKPNSFGY